MNKYLVIAVYIGLILITLLVFWQVRNFDFVNFDDQMYVYENQHVLDGLTWDGVIWAFTTGHGANWHPVTWLSHMLDCQIFGKDPGAMHLVNVFLHLVNTLLLFVVLRRMTGSLWPSAFVAAAFAIHPMHVESVAWIAERKDILSTLFWLLTMAAYAGYVKRPSVFRYTTALVLFAVGLMAKPMLVTLPFVLLLMDYWPLNRLEVDGSLLISDRQNCKASQRRPVWQCLIIEKVPFFALAAASSIITFIVQQSGGAMSTSDVFPLKVRVFNASISYFQYIKKMVWPSKLAAFYPHNGADISAAKTGVCILLLIGLTVLFLYLAGRKKYLATGWLWYLGTLLPVIGLIQVGSQAYADRYTYIPFIGLFMMIAWGAAELLSRFPHRKLVLGFLAAIVLTPMGLYSHRQVGFWKNDVALFSQAIEVTSNNVLAYNGLSSAYNDLGKFEEALEAAQQAIKINPNYYRAYNNLCATYIDLGKFEEAIKAARQAIKINPNYTDVHNNLSLAYAKLGKFAEAVKAAQQAIKINPDYTKAYNNLSAVYIDLGKFGEAIEAAQQAIAINPNGANQYTNLASAYLGLGRYPEAIEHFEKSLRIKPDSSKTHYYLAVSLQKTGQVGEAIGHYRSALQLNPNDLNLHKKLGILLARCGQFAQAKEHFRRIIQINPNDADAHYNLGLVSKKENQLTRAIEHFRRALQINPNDVKTLDTLAAAYASADRFDEAVSTAEKALKLAEAAGNENLTQEIKGHLKLFRQGRSYSEQINN